MPTSKVTSLPNLAYVASTFIILLTVITGTSDAEENEFKTASYRGKLD